MVLPTRLLTALDVMTDPNATHPEKQPAMRSPEILPRLIQWLNESYPDFSLVLYDIGARHGMHYHYRPLLQLNHFKVVGFEPDAAEAERLQADSSALRQVYPFAIGKTSETRTIHLTRHPGCSSLYLPNQSVLAEYPPTGMFEVVGQAQVQTISLDEFAQTYQPPLPDFLKIDTQGAEYDILQGATALLRQVSGIFLEAHMRPMYVGEALFPQIHQMLAKEGFRLIFCENNPNYAGEILELDVAYVRDGSTAADMVSLLRTVVFCVVHHNLEFAAHLVRRSLLSSEAKTQLLNVLSQPLQPSEWVISEDGTFNPRFTSTRTHNLGTIQEQWESDA